MTITPGELLETSIGQLRTLVAFLSEQLDQGGSGDAAQASAPEVRACKDMLVSLTVLLQGSPGLVSGGARSSGRVHPEPEPIFWAVERDFRDAESRFGYPSRAGAGSSNRATQCSRMCGGVPA